MAEYEGTPVPHSAVREYCAEHATMQIVWHQRRKGDSTWKMMTGVCHFPPGEEVSQVILAKRFRLPDAASGRTTDDEYVAFPSEEAEYAGLTSLVRYTTNQVVAETEKRIGEMQGDLVAETARLREELEAAKATAEANRVRPSRRAAVAPAPAPAPSAAPAPPPEAPAWAMAMVTAATQQSNAMCRFLDVATLTQPRHIMVFPLFSLCVCKEEKHEGVLDTTTLS